MPVSATSCFDHARFAIRVRETGLRPEEFAARVGCSMVWLWKLENGKAPPSMDMLGRLAAALGVHPGELLTAVPAAGDPAPDVAPAGAA